MLYLSQLPISGNTLALGFFGLAVGATLIVSLMLYYHWIRYGVNVLGTFAIMIGYAAGTAILLLAALGTFSQL